MVLRLQRRPELPASPPGTAATSSPRRWTTPATSTTTATATRPPRSTPPHRSRPGPPGVWDRLRPREDDSRRRRDRRPPGRRRRPLDRPARGGQTSGPVGGHRADDDDAPTRTRSTRVPTTRAPGRTRPVASRSSARTSRRTRRAAAAAGRAASTRRPCAPGDAAGRGRRRRRGTPAATHDPDDDALVHDDAFGEDIPVKPYDPRTGRAAAQAQPLAVLVSLLVLGGLVVGIVLGGQKLLTLINPASRDYTGQGTGDGADPRAGRRHPQRHRPHPGEGRRRRLRRPVRRTPRRPTPTRSGIQPGVYGMRAADERPGGPRPAAGPGGAAALPGHRARGPHGRRGRWPGWPSRPASRSRS